MPRSALSIFANSEIFRPRRIDVISVIDWQQFRFSNQKSKINNPKSSISPVPFPIADYRESRDPDFLPDFDRQLAACSYVVVPEGIYDKPQNAISSSSIQNSQNIPLITDHPALLTLPNRRCASTVQNGVSFKTKNGGTNRLQSRMT